MGLQDLLTAAGLAGKSLYEVFGVESTASSSAIKKSYHRLALQCHPDKVGDLSRFYVQFLAYDRLKTKIDH